MLEYLNMIIQYIEDYYYLPMIVFNTIVNLLINHTNASYELLEDGSYVIIGCLQWATCAN